jgi:hypothetical protein
MEYALRSQNSTEYIGSESFVILADDDLMINLVGIVMPYVSSEFVCT